MTKTNWVSWFVKIALRARYIILFLRFDLEFLDQADTICRSASNPDVLVQTLVLVNTQSLKKNRFFEA